MPMFHSLSTRYHHVPTCLILNNKNSLIPKEKSTNNSNNKSITVVTNAELCMLLKVSIVLKYFPAL